MYSWQQHDAPPGTATRQISTPFARLNAEPASDGELTESCTQRECEPSRVPWFIGAKERKCGGVGAKVW